MAEKKTTKSKNNKNKDKEKNSKQSSSSKGKQLELDDNAKVRKSIKELKKQRDREDTLTYHIMPGILIFASLFLAVCFLIPDKMGILRLLVAFLTGLLGGAKWLVPLCLAVEAFYWKQDYINFKVTKKSIISGLLTLFFGIFLQLIKRVGEVEGTYNPIDLYLDALEGNSSGFFGGFFGNLLYDFTGVGSWIICIFGIILFGFALFNITPADALFFIKNKIRERVYNANLAKEEMLREEIRIKNEEKKKKLAQAKEKSEAEENEDATVIRKRRAFIEDDDENAPVGEENILPEEEIKPTLSDSDDISAVFGQSDENGVVDINAFDRVVEENKEKSDYTTANSLLPDSVMDVSGTNLSEIFTNDASIAIAGETSSAAVMDGNEASIVERVCEESEEIEVQKEDVEITPTATVEETYHFPPINFLQTDPNPLTFTVTDELKQTSIKLVETLRNFGVKTKIMNICCGPTVTRYELQPEIGVRVRSIANLSDDIALHLAASGVRIEAPIPGKDAVGIEIPNKTVSTVYLRNLIESPSFENQKSKLTVGLGMDVAGSPVYMNIAKMPHLLIAGATGMGKSVCINTFIVSMLYKARPDEVKLILIDPKKVELSIYNGLPHLLVPVVSDPKKAAGSLAWAVNEMERRFLLIEEVGVRDIDTYNEVTKNDPEKEYMPKIVIIIDELADLMMTARDEVETSICRLAQKARAAGMHLVIGTQRPSVDVITGLIKANVPSRIACTVASQVDSRTIIDVSGAEKLLGRGDMLYAPVGSMKPIRVQGSFVSEKEIENIVEFLKNGKKYEYDTDIIESIEREAARCGEKKKGRGSSDSDDYDSGDDRDTILSSDEAIMPAIEIAIDSGSVSTSLLQRKLSLGYARAARIVDKLEKLGVVGPFEGSKPRKVLITREEYLQMRMNYEGSDE